MSSPRVLVNCRHDAGIGQAALEFEDTLARRFAVTRVGNGLNGIRFSLFGTCFATLIRASACSGWSLTPSSITYSKVMKSRGANSR